MSRFYNKNTALMVLDIDLISYLAGEKQETPVQGASFEVTFYESDGSTPVTGLTNIVFSESGIGIYVAEIDGQYIQTVGSNNVIKIVETATLANDIYLQADRTIEQRDF